MSQRLRVLTIGLIGFLLVSIITSATAIYYYQQYVSVSGKYVVLQDHYEALRGATLNVSVKINYGNGTDMNRSVYVFRGATALDALRAVAQVNATYWEGYHSFLIDGINNVFNNANGNNRWWEYSVNSELALLSADQYIVSEGDHIEWVYRMF